MPATHRSDRQFAEVGPLGAVPLATLGGRLAARLCDLALLFVPVYLVFAVVLGARTLSVVLISAGALVVYDALLTAKSGATPGKRIANIKVVRTGTGGPVGLGRAVLRALVCAVSGWLITAVFALVDERTHRGLHDRLTGTVVIAT